DSRKPLRDRAEPNDRKILDRIEACDPFCRHLAAPDTDKTHLPGGTLPQRPHQRGAEPITRLFSGDEKDIEGFGGAGGAHWGGHRSAAWSRTPRTNSRSRSAVAPMRSGSATMVLPATTAMPAASPPPRASARRGRSGGQRAPPILPALCRLDQHAPSRGHGNASALTKFRDAREHAVGAFSGLNRQHAGIGHDHRLADVE